MNVEHSWEILDSHSPLFETAFNGLRSTLSGDDFMQYPEEILEGLERSTSHDLTQSIGSRLDRIAIQSVLFGVKHALARKRGQPFPGNYTLEVVEDHVHVSLELEDGDESPSLD